MSEYIDLKHDNNILHLCLNRQDKKNALDLGMYQALADALIDADKNPDVRVVYIYGAGDAFCSGNDLSDFLKNPPKDLNAPVFQFMNAIANAKKPIVAAVSGLAVGIGTTMLLHFDLIYADDTAKFILPFVQLGVCAEAGSSLLLPMLFGRQKAAELLLCGEPFSAQDAKDAGFVNQIVKTEDLQETALARAEMLAKQPPNALIETKRLTKEPIKAQVAEAIREESEQFLKLLQQEESKKIMSAFFKR